MIIFSWTHIYAIPASYTIQGAVSYMSFYKEQTSGTPFSSGMDLLWTCLVKYVTNIFTDGGQWSCQRNGGMPVHIW